MDLSRRDVLGRAALVATVGGLAGCSGDGGGGTTTETPTDTPTETPTPTDTPTDTPTPTPAEPTPTGTDAQSEYPDYNWGQLDDASPTETTEIRLKSFAFEPLIASVDAGATVTFENKDGVGHSVTIPGLGVDRTLGGGEQFSLTFAHEGTYDVVCRFHPSDMLGRVVVG